MKKLLITTLLFYLTLSVNAKGIKCDLNSVIYASGIDKSSIAISIKEADTKKTVYEQNEKILMHPASVQKILTLPAAIDVLGEDYNFSTKLYSRNPNGYLFKLGGDPYFTSGDLNNLVKNIDSQKVKQIYIDDSILEAKDWGEGWQWDDDLNTSMPKFNSYNMDENRMRITVMKSNYGN